MNQKVSSIDLNDLRNQFVSETRNLIMSLETGTLQQVEESKKRLNEIIQMIKSIQDLKKT